MTLPREMQPYLPRLTHASHVVHMSLSSIRSVTFRNGLDVCRVIIDSVARGTLLYKMRAVRIKFITGGSTTCSLDAIRQNPLQESEGLQPRPTRPNHTVSHHRSPRLAPSSSTRVYRYGDPLCREEKTPYESARSCRCPNLAMLWHRV
jgi:hypothetical protein